MWSSDEAPSPADAREPATPPVAIPASPSRLSSLPLSVSMNSAEVTSNHTNSTKGEPADEMRDNLSHSAPDSSSAVIVSSHNILSDGKTTLAMASSPSSSGRIYTQAASSLGYVMQPVSATLGSYFTATSSGVSHWWQTVTGKRVDIVGQFLVCAKTVLGAEVAFVLDNELLQEHGGSFLLVLKRHLRPHHRNPEQLQLEIGDETCALVTHLSISPFVGEVPKSSSAAGAPALLPAPSAAGAAAGNDSASNRTLVTVGFDVGTDSQASKGEASRKKMKTDVSRFGSIAEPNSRSSLHAVRPTYGFRKADDASKVGETPSSSVFDLQAPKIVLNSSSAAQLSSLQALYLEGHGLYIVPGDIGKFKSLTTLFAAGNALSALPAQLSELADTLKTLELQQNKLASWPPALRACTLLETLQLNDNLLKEVPVDVGKLTKLRELHLVRNRLHTVRMNLNECAMLEVLRLQGNNLGPKSLPDECFAGLNRLRVLTLNGNRLTTLPSSLSKCTALLELDLRRNSLVELPEDFGSLCNLVALRASHNKLSSFPASIGACQMLEELDISHNELSELPAEIGSGPGPALVRLDLSHNKLASLPLSTRDLTGLRELHLDNNQFTDFPVPEIWYMTELETLTAAHNLFIEIPEGLTTCGALREISLAHTRLRQLPVNLHDLQRLRFLDASDSFLTDFPDLQRQLPELVVLRLHNNPPHTMRDKIAVSADVQGPAEIRLLQSLPASLADSLTGLHEITVADVSIKVTARRKQIDLPFGDATDVQPFSRVVASCPHPLLVFGLAELAAMRIHDVSFSEVAEELSQSLLDMLLSGVAPEAVLVAELGLAELRADTAQEAARALGSLSYLEAFQFALFKADGFAKMWRKFSSTPADEVTTRMSLMTAIGNLGFHPLVRVGIVEQHSLEPFVSLVRDPNQMSGIAKKTRRMLAIFGVHNGNEHLMCDFPKNLCWCGSATFGHHHDDEIDHVESPNARHGQVVAEPVIPFSHPQRGVRVLSLDGGGMRGVVVIEVLRAVEVACECRVSDMFDLIVGTSTGGILASMIGLRGYTLTECASLYNALGKSVFIKPGTTTVEAAETSIGDAISEPETDSEAEVEAVATTESTPNASWDPWSKVVGGYKMLRTGAYYSGEPLHQIIKSKVGNFEMIDSSENDGCPCVAVPATLVSVYPPELYLFRNYEYPLCKSLPASSSASTPIENGLEHPESPHAATSAGSNNIPGSSAQFQVDQLLSRYPGTSRGLLPNALRATSAAPSYFDEFVEPDTGRRFVDGGLIANNPAGVALHEARSLWPGRRVDLLLSIGTGLEVSQTGVAGYQGVVASVLQALTSPAPVHEVLSDTLNTPAAARACDTAAAAREDVYYRFNPLAEAFSMPLDETDDKKLDLLRSETRRYLRTSKCVAMLEQIAAIVKRCDTSQGRHTKKA